MESDFSLKEAVVLALRLGVSAVIFISLACGAKPTDPRTVIPADALVYLESSDLGKSLEAITGNAKFQQLAQTTPDLSALGGVKVAIAVTGFETSEQAVTDEKSVLNLQPRFVAVVETNAWGWQATRFVEDKLGEFVNEAYGGAIELEITTRKDGEFYVWTSPDGRKAYALQQGSLVFFGNDHTAIDRCQAVKRGEADAITKNPKITDGERLAFGYVSPEGVGQIANIAGISLAIGASEEDEVKSFVARVLPEILRNSVRELSWTALKTDGGIEDKFAIGLDEESARVFSESIVPAEGRETALARFVPEAAASATRYQLRDAQIAWRSLVLTVRKKTDETSGSLIAAFSGSLFEPYGIEDAEMFLGSVGTELVTVKLNADEEDAVVVASVKDAGKVRSSLAKEIKLGDAPENQFGAQVWKSEDGEFAAAFVGDVVIAGDVDTVLKCLEANQPGSASANKFAASDAAAFTIGSGAANPEKLVAVLAEPKEQNETVPLTYTSETRFNQKGIERRTVSDFGMIGWILERLAAE